MNQTRNTPDVPRIPVGEARELPVQRIIVTRRTFARRTMAAAALASGATVAAAHPGHGTAPDDPSAAVWIGCAMLAAACLATVRAVAARRAAGGSL